MQDILLTLQSVAKTQLNQYWNISQYALSEPDPIKSISLFDLAYRKKDRANNQFNTIQGMTQIYKLAAHVPWQIERSYPLFKVG